ncbi:STAS domain-containing protein [Rufibacter latericius]|uniref:STAS domain-containing protein n=1 Tax=Rufibacter latericius TaxID=2487040 RepID=A0A3M9MMZ0_9BACT|nr:STAS domain-containing protein [Rufibacter latericius]RNI26879.1 STAS domain-containing protein [Rufibacter latericius]
MNKESAAALKGKKKQILEAWMANQLKDAALRDDLMSVSELQQQSEEFLSSLLKAFASPQAEDTESSGYESIHDILSEISISRARQGFSPRETSAYILSLKEVLSHTLEDRFKDDTAVLYREIISMNKIMDSLSLITTETYIKGREEVILRQTNEMSEISTPVIRVWEGILALPIIGTLDSARTQVVMEALLEEIVATGSRIAILDISGVPTVDSLVAQHLIKTVSAARLMGAECIISGIRAEIAQTIVHLGIDLTNIYTKATLASALKMSFSMLNIQVSKAGLNGQIGSKQNFGF